MKRRAILGNRKLQLFTKRFFPAGNYTWTVPPGCTEVDVFLVGAGAGGKYAGGGAGYTKTLKKNATGWRDGGAISVNPGELINITVGKGVVLQVDIQNLKIARIAPMEVVLRSLHLILLVAEMEDLEVALTEMIQQRIIGA